MEKEHQSRYEVNRNVRYILVRHDVDLGRLDYSYIGSTLYISGDLVKGTSGDFTSASIEAMARDLASIREVRDVQFDLANWSIASGGGAWQITKKRRPLAGQYGSYGSGAADQTVVIEKPETIVQVLDDIKKKEGPATDPDKKK